MKKCKFTISGNHQWKEIYNPSFSETGIRHFKCNFCGIIDDTGVSISDKELSTNITPNEGGKTTQ